MININNIRHVWLWHDKTKVDLFKKIFLYVDHIMTTYICRLASRVLEGRNGDILPLPISYVMLLQVPTVFVL